MIYCLFNISNESAPQLTTSEGHTIALHKQTASQMSMSLNQNTNPNPSTLDSPRLKAEKNELSTSFTFSHLPLAHHNDREKHEPDWDDTSPGMSDSLLSLDFDSANELGSSALSSTLSEASPQVITPRDSIANTTLFSPLSDNMFTTENESTDQSMLPPAPKRFCSDQSLSTFPVPATADFTLFPREDEEGFSTPMIGTQSSLSTVSHSNDVLNLLNSLNVPGTVIQPQSTNVGPPLTASLSEISASPCLAQDVLTQCGTSASRGARRKRRDADELLPIDAPIQPRTYHTESATSRRDATDSMKSRNLSPRYGQDLPMTPNHPTEGPHNTDARSLKRLSNTLAARRSRHRKAEELKKLYDTIEELKSEVAMWKKRCENAERQLDSPWLMTPSI